MHFGENKIQESENKWQGIKNKYPNLQLHLLGKLQSNKAKKAVKLFDYIHSLDNAKLASKIKSKPTVACIEWIDPLMMAGNWIPEMVDIAGGIHILGHSGKDSHWIKFNEILEKNPDIIIFLPCGFNIEKTKSELKNFLNQNNDWQKLKSFKNKKFYIADGNQFFNRPGPRLVESLEIFAEIIHPNLFNFNHKEIGWINYHA